MRIIEKSCVAALLVVCVTSGFGADISSGGKFYHGERGANFFDPDYGPQKFDDGFKKWIVFHGFKTNDMIGKNQ